MAEDSSDDLFIQTDQIELGDDISGPKLAQVAAIQALNASTVNSQAYIIAVDNFESTLFPHLDNEYKEAVKKQTAEIEKEGKLFSNGPGQLFLARFKFRELMALINRMKPKDEVLKT